MKYYTQQHKQLTLDLVRSSRDNLNKSNRWVQMGDLLLWADIEKEYYKMMDGNMLLRQKRDDAPEGTFFLTLPKYGS